MRKPKGVIAALWEEVNPEEIPVDVVFILKSDLQQLRRQLNAYQRAGKTVYVDMDFVDGLSDGEAAVAFLKGLGVDGLISVKIKNFHACRKLGLPFVLRVFALDSRAVEKAFEQVISNDVDMVEILPGCAALKIGSRFKSAGIRVVAAGLVSSQNELRELLSVVDGVSTSSRELWRVKL